MFRQRNIGKGSKVFITFDYSYDPSWKEPSKTLRSRDGGREGVREGGE
jgi:hypothetical protein